MFVLTFANKEDVTRKDDRDEDVDEPSDSDDKAWEELEKRRFEGRLEIWKRDLQNFLVKEVAVSDEIAKSIPVVPTGDNKKSRQNKHPLRLPDREDWFNKFWEVCCLRVKETQLFLKVNSDRMSTDNVTETPEFEEKVFNSSLGNYIHFIC